MTKEEYEILGSKRKNSAIHISSLKNSNPRTLLYGYDFDRNSVHLYLKGVWFTYVRYNNHGDLLEQKDMYDIPIAAGHCYYIPNKRVYWEMSDFEFCLLLKEGGVPIYFTNSNGNVVPQQFYGKTLQQLS